MQVYAVFFCLHLHVHLQDLVHGGSVTEIDYSGLAGEAEKNKHNLLKFLNTSRVREIYERQYQKLLTKIIDNEKDTLDQSGRRVTEIDYSGLAGEAEKNKHNLLKFLNTSRVREIYERQYQKLLTKIIGVVPSTRRIVSGHNTSIEAVPWQVSLREKTFPICGGSVVTDLWLITAAHCLLRARPSDLSVRLGSSWKTFGGEMYDVRASFVHPNYVIKSKVNDVGLVQLYAPLRFTARVLPIRLIAREKKLPATQAAIVSGWGKLKEGGASATILQSASMSTISMKLCKRSGLDRKAIDPASMFCAGSFSQNTPDACQGDSGGPIVSEGVLIGVVSWGLGCARGNFPGVYTRLSYPVIWDWVMEHIKAPSKIEPEPEGP